MSDEPTAVLKVLIADDHEAVRRGVRLMTDGVSGVVVVAEAATGAEAVDMCRVHDPRAVLMDIDMPEMNGVEATRVLHREMPHVNVLMFTVHDEEETIYDAVRAGASGYLTKSSGVEELMSALDAVRYGGGYMTPKAAQKALEFLVKRSQMAERAVRATDMTTEREREILEMLAQGLTARGIGKRLGISDRTVNTHVAHIYRRLGVNSRVDAVREGMRLGLVQQSSIDL